MSNDSQINSGTLFQSFTSEIHHYKNGNLLLMFNLFWTLKICGIRMDDHYLILLYSSYMLLHYSPTRITQVFIQQVPEGWTSMSLHTIFMSINFPPPQFCILADIQLFCMSKMTFEVELTIKNLKVGGLSCCFMSLLTTFSQGFDTTVEGQACEYWLTPIQNWENVTFNVAFQYVLYLFLHGALVRIHVCQLFIFFCDEILLNALQTMDDLCNHTNYSLLIKDKKNMNLCTLPAFPFSFGTKLIPLSRFLAANPGGCTFQDPPHLMSARSVSASCSILS